MSLTIELVHESTLVGAVDSFLKELVHVRPFLLQRYADVLEEMAERWLNEIGSNALKEVDPQWLSAYIAAAADPALAMKALQEFYRWAVQRTLIAENPLLFHK